MDKALIAQELVKIAKSLFADNLLVNMDRRKAAKIVNELIDYYSKGFFTDEYWHPIHSIFKAFQQNSISASIEKTEYRNDDKGRNIAKEWTIEVEFIDKKGKKQTLNGKIIASGAGPVEDPLSRYDVTGYVS